jgi:hypothetical protein
VFNSLDFSTVVTSSYAAAALKGVKAGAFASRPSAFPSTILEKESQQWRTRPATDYGLYPPRAVHIGTNRMHSNIVTTISASASDNLYMFPIPPDCLRGGRRHQSLRPAGTTGNIVLQVGTPAPHGLRHLHPVGHCGPGDQVHQP